MRASEAGGPQGRILHFRRNVRIFFSTKCNYLFSNVMFFIYFWRNVIGGTHRTLIKLNETIRADLNPN